MTIRPKDPGERFWTWVDRTGKCWLWTGSTSTGGYGRIFWDGKQRQAHRVAYELLIGSIPEGLQLDHICRDRACVNPQHLEAVPLKENLRRGISPPAINGRKTHCVNGHEYTPENTRSTAKGRRCKACERERGVKQAAAEKVLRHSTIKTAACSICGAEFQYVGQRRTACSDACRKERGRQSARRHAQLKRAAR